MTINLQRTLTINYIYPLIRLYDKNMISIRRYIFPKSNTRIFNFKIFKPKLLNNNYYIPSSYSIISSFNIDNLYYIDSESDDYNFTDLRYKE